MGLLAPWFLAGVAAIGLPIYLHLLRRHATTPKPFSSLMFFEPRTQSSLQHRRLRYLWLLALRIALLVLVALAFADPFITRPAASVSHDTLTLLVIDSSFSMRAGTRLSDAKRDAQTVLAAHRGSSPVQVMALDSQMHALTQATRDTATARAAIESVRPGDARSSFAELARAVRLTAESTHTPVALHLFSDMQRSSLAASFSEMALPDGVTLTLHPVATAAVPNWTIDSVTAPGQLFGRAREKDGKDAKPVRVQAIVAGYGTPAATRHVALIVNGKTMATQDVQVPAGGRASVEFPSLDVPYGFSRCEVRLDAADALHGDDGYVFAVERSDPQRVLFVRNESDTRSPLFFTHALGSAAESAFDLQTVTLDQAAGQSQALAKYAFIVLSNVPTVSTAFERDLLTYVRDGGSLWVAMGTAAAGRSRVPVFGEAIETIHDYARELPRGRERFLSIGDADPSHVSVGTAAGHFAGVKFYYAVGVDAANARVVARLTDRTPLLLEKTIGEGRVLLFTSGLDNLTNDFPLHPAFVAFVEQTARYLSGTDRRGGAHVVDSYLALRSLHEQPSSAAAAASGGAAQSLGVEVIDPEGHRPLSLGQSSTTESVRLSQAGFYQVRLANGRQEVVGVNPDRRESNLDVIPDDVLASWRGSGAGQAGQTAKAATPTAASTTGAPTTGSATTGAATTAAAGETSEQREPYSLWWHIMVLALVAALSESWLASRYLGARREDA
jgi:hypothetical protein